MKYYAGIGARKTPQNMLAQMTDIAKTLETEGYILRSGGAQGADSAFALGTTNKEEYLPPSAPYYKKGIRPTPQIMEKAIEIVKSTHPAAHNLKPYVMELMARNCCQILGNNLDTPSEFVLCWTPDGADGTRILTSPLTGGTGQAIRLAALHRIPVINMKNPKWKSQLFQILNKA